MANAMNSKITTKNIDKVLAFLPLFERKELKLYQVRTDISLLDPYVYACEVDNFIQTLYQEGFVVSFDWMAWSKESKRLVKRPELLDSVDIATIQKLLTTHVRAERFCSGHIAGMIDNGHILTILQRLAVIRSGMTSVPSTWRNNHGDKMLEKVTVVKGDITQQPVDAIVNAANESLLGGGGVDGAIHRAAGPLLLEECRKLNGRSTGEAKLTQGYNLPAKWVIHTVGPVWRDGAHQEDRLLAQCYRNSLALAAQHSIRTIAFPAISTGAYGFPLDRATKIAVNEVKKFLTTSSSIEQITFVCFGGEAYRCYLATVRETFG
jgi:O-acetyl-ADP-ribose deacetylase (regulator of RNase III)